MLHLLSDTRFAMARITKVKDDFRPTMRVKKDEQKLLIALSKKLGLDVSSIFRLALHRLAEAEGIKAA